MAYLSVLGALLPYILLAGLLLLAVVMFLAGYWLILPGLAGLPWRPTSSARIRKALEVARLQPGETIYDLGSGDGRVLVMAAREFQARAVGVEISPIYCLVGRFSAQMHGLEGLVRVVRGDFFTTDLSGADVVFAYMTSRQAARLKPVLDRQLQQGVRVVTISFDLDGWEPDQVDVAGLIFLYEMPPHPGSLETYLAKRL